MKANFLNLDAFCNQLKADVDRLVMLPPAVRNWASQMVHRELRRGDWREVCNTLHLHFRTIVTPREYRLLLQQERARLMDNRANIPLVALSYSERRFANQFRVASAALYDEYPWLSKAMASGEDVIELVLHEAEELVSHYAEAVYAMVSAGDSANPYTSITLEHAQKLAVAWQKKLEHQALTAEGVVELVAMSSELERPLRPEADYRLWLLKDKQAFIREGYMMRHCVGSYDPEPQQLIMSLRNPEGVSLLTAELRIRENTLTVKQVRGIRNETPGSRVLGAFRALLGVAAVRLGHVLAEEAPALYETPLAINIVGNNPFGGLDALVQGTSAIEFQMGQLPDLQIDILIARLRQRGANL